MPNFRWSTCFVLNNTLKLPVEAIYALDEIKDASLASLKQAKKGKVLLKL